MNLDMPSQPPQPALPTSRGATFPWVKVASIGALLTPIVLIVLTVVFVLGQREQRRREAEGLAALQQDIRVIAAEVRASHVSLWVGMKDVMNHCFATNGEVTCTFVNLRNEPLNDERFSDDPLINA
jgi:hypothetical protein